MCPVMLQMKQIQLLFPFPAPNACTGSAMEEFPNINSTSRVAGECVHLILISVSGSGFRKIWEVVVKIIEV